MTDPDRKAESDKGNPAMPDTSVRIRKKCSRDGHLLRAESRHMLRKPNREKDGYITWNRCVAVSFWQHREVCTRWRCNYATEWADSQEPVRGIHSLTLYESEQRKFDRGEVIHA